MDTIEQIKAMFPDIDWNQVSDVNRAMNWELWHGPLPGDYWTDIEPLEHYTWKGYEAGQNDLRDMLAELPTALYWDEDCDILTYSNPEFDEDNWDNWDEDYGWIGGDSWTEINPLEVILHKEVFKHVF